MNRAFTFQAYPNSSSLCSLSSLSRGPHQKVLAFSYAHPSLFPDIGRMRKFDRNYLKGVADNADAAKEVYPGWTPRVYFIAEEGGEEWQRLCKLSCQYPEVR